MIRLFNKPIILLIGAGSRKNHLTSVSYELNELTESFGSSDKKKLIDFRINFSFTSKNILKSLRDCENKLAILHISGHSNADGWVGDDDDVVYTHSIAETLNKWKHKPRLVFLNGCCNHQQVGMFKDAGVSIVIATTSMVFDRLAKDLSVRFYIELFKEKDPTLGKPTVESSLKYAEDNAGIGNKNGVRRCADFKDLSLSNNEWDWGVFPLNNDFKGWSRKDVLYSKFSKRKKIIIFILGFFVFFVSIPLVVPYQVEIDKRFKRSPESVLSSEKDTFKGNFGYVIFGKYRELYDDESLYFSKKPRVYDKKNGKGYIGFRLKPFSYSGWFYVRHIVSDEVFVCVKYNVSFLGKNTKKNVHDSRCSRS